MIEGNDPKNQCEITFRYNELKHHYGILDAYIKRFEEKLIELERTIDARNITKATQLKFKLYLVKNED